MEVSRLVQKLGIENVKIFDANRQVLHAFAYTGISVTICVPNEEIISLAVSTQAACTWIRNNVKRFVPATKITYIMVGNEVNIPNPNSCLFVFCSSIYLFVGRHPLSSSHSCGRQSLLTQLKLAFLHDAYCLRSDGSQQVQIVVMSSL
jgi:hypothetical protein